MSESRPDPTGPTELRIAPPSPAPSRRTLPEAFLALGYVETRVDRLHREVFGEGAEAGLRSEVHAIGRDVQEIRRMHAVTSRVVCAAMIAIAAALWWMAARAGGA